MNCICDNEVCTCDAAIAADSPVVTYSQIAFWIRIFAVITLIWALGLLWVAYEVVTGPTVAAIQDWISTAAQALVSALPMTPFF
jgi:hypothetical protein